MKAKAGWGLAVILGLVFLAGCPPKFRYHPTDPANPNYKTPILTPAPDLTQTFFAYTATPTFTMTPTFTPIQETWTWTLTFTWTPTSTWTPTASPTTTPKPKRVFVTNSITTIGDLGGYSGADSTCQTSADGAGLGGIWKAWLSTVAGTAPNQIADVGPWYLVDGVTKVANNMLDLTDGTIATAINYDEFGNFLTGALYTWTGTSEFGDLMEHCNNWTAATDTYVGKMGRADLADYRWTNYSNTGCGSATSGVRLYCFEQ